MSPKKEDTMNMIYKEIKCPKCGGTDWFESKRNVTRGAGLYLRGTTKSFKVCRSCDEIMSELVRVPTSEIHIRRAKLLQMKIGRIIIVALTVLMAFMMIIAD